MSWHWHQRGVICPLCGEERKPVGSRMQEAIVVGGRPVPEHVAEAALADDPDDDSDAFWNKPDFGQRWDDKTNEVLAKALAGDLPPLVPQDANSQAVLANAQLVKE